MTRIRELVQEREEIDAELLSVLNITATEPKGRKQQTCSKCGKAGHTARTCTDVQG
jgi:hypothetical protein